MGSGQEAVVDAELRVRGVLGLRVAGASVTPTILSANTQAQAVMSQSSYMASNDPRLHFGLGSETTADINDSMAPSMAIVTAGPSRP